MDVIPFGGWDRCLRLVSGKAEALVTLDVGPRVIRYGLIDGPNEFYQSPKDAGRTGGDEYRGYGGHRLWVAPEVPELTYVPENEPVEHQVEAEWHVFRSKPDRRGLQKELRLTPLSAHNGFKIEHRVSNHGAATVEMALWALTVMAEGGECLFPQHPFVPHADRLLPVRPLVLWGYTDMSDPRWSWGRRVVRLRQDPQSGPIKVGALIQQGYAAYANHGNVFLKRFPYEEGAAYPDMGCNFETFTRHDMLEVESLGPLRQLAPGEVALHREAWYLEAGATPPGDDEACGDWLEALVAQRPL
ncbi:MAG TPA: hypothetical protein VM328_00920 [Fimbriimonadaceae bacterium]|nr:hypothetical protein [Fimbriimonadaceae bacterium]